jgi:hypothetical protein
MHMSSSSRPGSRALVSNEFERFGGDLADLERAVADKAAAENAAEELVEADLHCAE